MKLPFFGESKKAEESAGRGYVPTDRVRELTGRGFSELDTIDVLRREGFSPDEIDKALTQTLKEGVTGNPADAMQQQQMPWQEQQPQMQPMQQPQAQPQYASFPQSRQPAQQPQKEQPEEADAAYHGGFAAESRAGFVRNPGKFAARRILPRLSGRGIHRLRGAGTHARHRG